MAIKHTVLFLLLLLLPSVALGQSCAQSALNTEFTTDPTSRTYASCPGFPNGDDQCVLDKFNAPCTGNAACKVDNILSREVLYETIIDSTELEKLSRSTAANDVARKSQLDWILHGTSFNLAKSSWQQKWKNIFTPADSPLTNTKINDAQLKDSPRCDIVCHKGSGCTLADVSCGLRGAECP